MDMSNLVNLFIYSRVSEINRRAGQENKFILDFDFEAAASIYTYRCWAQ